jgi:hypothetical protein
VVVILHIRAWDQQLIRFNTIFGGDTAHYSLGSTTYSLQHCLWMWFCPLQHGIYKLFPSTLSVEVILHITAGDIQFIPFNTLWGVDTAHCSLGSTPHYFQRCLLWWYFTLKLGIYNSFHSTLSVEVILHITGGDLELIPFNTVGGGDTAHYI